MKKNVTSVWLKGRGDVPVCPHCNSVMEVEYRDSMGYRIDYKCPRCSEKHFIILEVIS